MKAFVFVVLGTVAFFGTAFFLGHLLGRAISGLPIP